MKNLANFIKKIKNIKKIFVFALEIFYYCGLRKGELKGLTWKDIYFDKKDDLLNDFLKKDSPYQFDMEPIFM